MLLDPLIIQKLEQFYVTGMVSRKSFTLKQRSCGAEFIIRWLATEVIKSSQKL